MADQPEYSDLPTVKVYPEQHRFLKIYKLKNNLDTVPEALEDICSKVDENGQIIYG